MSPTAHPTPSSWRRRRRGRAPPHEAVRGRRSGRGGSRHRQPGERIGHHPHDLNDGLLGGPTRGRRERYASSRSHRGDLLDVESARRPEAAHEAGIQAGRNNRILQRAGVARRLTDEVGEPIEEIGLRRGGAAMRSTESPAPPRNGGAEPRLHRPRRSARREMASAPHRPPLVSSGGAREVET